MEPHLKSCYILEELQQNHERKQWIEKHGGSEADNRRLIEFARKRADSDLQERPVTATQVQELIRREIKEGKQSQDGH